jgi:hypothetical protein
MQDIDFAQIPFRLGLELEEEYFSLTLSCKDDVLTRAVLLTHDDSLRLLIHLALLLDVEAEKLLIGMPDKWGGEAPCEVSGLNYPRRHHMMQFA